ncbi:hypothetical protein LCGC14_2442920, partial [marine sediment metagenome]
MQRHLSDIPVIVDENGDVAVSSGKLGVVGIGDGNAGDFALLEENGNTIFRYSLPHGGVVIDKKGNVYLSSGKITGAFALDIVVKLNSLGRNIWSSSTIKQQPPDWTDNGGSVYITLDTNDDLLLCGQEWEDPSDIWKLNGVTGEIIWSRYTGMTITQGLRHLATDSENNVIVVGSGQTRDDHFVVMKYDSDGQLIWGQTGIPPAISLYPESFSVCVDPDDNIYISIFNVFQTGPPEGNVIAIKYDKFGNEISKIFPPQSFIDEFPAATGYAGFPITCDHLGNMFMIFKPSSLNQKRLFSLNPDGEERWISDVLGVGSVVEKLTVDSTGNLFVSREFLGIRYVDGATGAVLTDYPLPSNFPTRVDLVTVSRPEALIGPILSGPSNLFDSGHFLDYNIPAPDQPFVGSEGDEAQVPGDIN